MENLVQFRCMTRNDIIDLHFSDVKNPVGCANTVMKRLSRDKYVEYNPNYRPYLYFLSPSPIKKNSQKIPHFLAILNFYKQIKNFEDPVHFEVEPKYGSYMEPDVFMIWRNTPYFVEIQRSNYSKKMMDTKLQRYHSFFKTNIWKTEWWQSFKEGFPKVWIISSKTYTIPNEDFEVIQTSSVEQLLRGEETDSQSFLSLDEF